MWKVLEKQPFFRADMAGLGKYHTGGYGRIGVYRVKVNYCKKSLTLLFGAEFSQNTLNIPFC